MRTTTRARRHYQEVIEHLYSDAPPAFALEAQPGSGQVTLTWQPAQRAVRYRVFIAGQPALTDLALTLHSATVTGLTNGVPVSCFVRAYSVSGEYVDSDVVVVTPQLIPTQSYDFGVNPTLTQSGGPALSLTRAGNAATWDGNGVLEYIGAHEAPFGDAIRVENVITNPSAPATQTKTLRAGKWTVQHFGDGQTVLSGLATGTVTDGAPLTIELTASGDVTFTVSGSPTGLMCHRGSVVHPFQAALAYLLISGKTPYLSILRGETPINTDAAPNLGAGWSASGIASQGRSPNASAVAPDGSRLYRSTATNDGATARRRFHSGSDYGNVTGPFVAEFAIGKFSNRAFGIEIGVNFFASGYYVIVNPSTGAVNFAGGGYGSNIPTAVSLTILHETASHRWARLKFTIGSAPTHLQLRFGHGAALDSNTVAALTYADNGTGFIEGWGPFVRAGNEWLTPQLPSDGARAQPVLTSTPGGNYNASELSLEGRYVVEDTGTARTLRAFSGAGNPLLRVTSSNAVEVVLGAMTLTGATITPGVPFRVACGLKSGDHALCVEGALVTSTNAAAPAATATEYHGCDASGANPLCGGIYYERLYNTRLANSALQSLTGGGGQQSSTAAISYPAEGAVVNGAGMWIKTTKGDISGSISGVDIYVDGDLYGPCPAAPDGGGVSKLLVYAQPGTHSVYALYRLASGQTVQTPAVSFTVRARVIGSPSCGLFLQQARIDGSSGFYRELPYLSSMWQNALTHANVAGLQINVSWEQYVDSQGVYNLHEIKNIIDAVNALGKRVMLWFYGADYWGRQCVPTFMLGNSAYGQSYTRSNTQRAGVYGWSDRVAAGGCPHYWNANVWSELIDHIDWWADELYGYPGFHGWVIGESVMINQLGNTVNQGLIANGYGNGNYNAGVLELYWQIVKAFQDRFPGYPVLPCMNSDAGTDSAMLTAMQRYRSGGRFFGYRDFAAEKTGTYGQDYGQSGLTSAQRAALTDWLPAGTLLNGKTERATHIAFEAAVWGGSPRDQRTAFWTHAKTTVPRWGADIVQWAINNNLAYGTTDRTTTDAWLAAKPNFIDAIVKPDFLANP